MFTRKQVCTLLSFDEEDFKVIARHGYLPIIHTPVGATEEIRDHTKERGWNWFAPFDVFLLALFVHFGIILGTPGNAREMAIQIAEAAGHIFGLGPTAGADAHSEIWIGRLGGQIVSGTLQQVIGLVGTDALPENSANLALVNADLTLRMLHQRARTIGIAFPTAADLDAR